MLKSRQSSCFHALAGVGRSCKKQSNYKAFKRSCHTQFMPKNSGEINKERKESGSKNLKNRNKKL